MVHLNSILFKSIHRVIRNVVITPIYSLKIKTSIVRTHFP